MLFASSRDALRRALVGVAIEIQGTDFSEIAYEIGEYMTLSTLTICSVLCAILFYGRTLLVADRNLTPFLVLDKAQRGN